MIAPVRSPAWELRGSFFRELHDARALRVALDLPGFVANVARHDGAKDHLPLWSPATFAKDYRKKDRVEAVTAWAVDVDQVHATLGEAVAKLEAALPVAWAVHTSYSSAPGALKLRAIAPVSRPLSAEEHGILWPIFARVLEAGGVELDASCKDASRAYYVPAVPPSGCYAWHLSVGEAIDVDAWVRDARDAAALRAEADELERRAAELRRAARATRGPTLSPEGRARRYLATMPPSISGAHGDDALFRAALALHGFGLEPHVALALLKTDFNPRCRPPWPERNLARKVREAARARLPAGYLLEGRRAS